jgi:hypothetical protein
MSKHLFVNVMIGLQVCAIGQYVFQKSWSLAVYWFACLLINIVVTYGLGK